MAQGGQFSHRAIRPRPTFQPMCILTLFTASVFTHQMEKEGLLKVKTTRDQDMVASVDPSNAAVREFKPHSSTTGDIEAKEKKKAAAAAATEGASGASSTGGSGSGDASKKIEVLELFKPHGSTTAFWTAATPESDE